MRRGLPFEASAKEGFALPLILAIVAIFLAVVGVIIYVGVVIYLQSTSHFKPQHQSPVIPTPTTSSINETADWKFYQNSKLGFSIKYPKELSEPTESILSTSTVLEFLNAESRVQLSISVGVVYDQSKQRELSYKEIATIDGKQPDLITVDDQPAAYIKIRDEDLIPPKPNPFNEVAIQKGRNVYTIYFSLSNDLKKQENEQIIFDQILSTFQFLD